MCGDFYSAEVSHRAIDHKKHTAVVWDADSGTLLQVLGQKLIRESLDILYIQLFRESTTTLKIKFINF